MREDRVKLIIKKTIYSVLCRKATCQAHLRLEKVNSC